MSVSVRLNPLLAIGTLVTVAIVAGLLIAGRSTPDGGAAANQDPASTQVMKPSAPLDIVTAAPANTALELSRRLFKTSPVAVVAAADNAEAQRLAIAAATGLGVPMLIDHDDVPAELDRLGSDSVLTFGQTRDIAGAAPIPLDDASVAAEVAKQRSADGPVSPRTLDAVVMTRSAQADAVAVAIARIAGAHVVELPGGDPRTAPDVASYFAQHPDQPVIAIGATFARLAYPLDVVRNNIEQPTGGYLALNKHYTAMYGHPGAPQLGVLGEQGVRASIERVGRLVRKYQRAAPDTEFVPTFEIIATVASASAGKDKNFSTETPIKDLLPMIDAAEKAGIYVILDLQPGRTDFLTQAKRYQSLLERPHVGLALDPEWRLKKNQKHLVQIGSVTAAEISRTADWLADLTRAKGLPQKIFVLHQFSSSMIKDRPKLDTAHPELATVIHVDGSGPQGAKQETWRHLRAKAPRGIGWGWKNFVDEDSPMLTAEQTWRRVAPHPELVTYQ
jgi:hypothetical protein